MKEIDVNKFSNLTFDNVDCNNNLESIIVRDNFLLKMHLVIMCVEGDFSFVSGSGKHICTAGSICLLVKDSICKITSVSDDCRICMVASHTSAFHFAASSMTNLMMFFRHYLEHPVSVISADEMNDAISIYRCMKSICGRNGYVFQKEMREAMDIALFYLLLAHVNAVDKSLGGKSRRQRQIFEQFIMDVGNNFREHRKLDFYADLQCVTTKYLSYVVKAESGLSARQWICDNIMIEARELLSRKKLSVQEISDHFNFPDQSFFGKFFKAHEGIGPLQYQKSLERVIF